MATYKVLQDIEAEEKLIGPLTMRQFVYACIAAACLYVSFLLLTKHAPFMLIVVLPMAGLAGFFAWPWRGDQPTEVWALAKIRFMVKPRRRIWNQSGRQDLVTITAPKKIETDYTNGLSENEVKSRLRALADTIDSRGWAVKNVNVNLSMQPALVMGEPTSDRLISVESLPVEVSSSDVQAADDMLDPQANPVAHQFDTMIEASSKAHRQKIMAQMQQATNPPVRQQIPAAPTPQAAAPAAPAAAQPQNFWFMNQPTPAAPQTAKSAPPPGAVTFNAQVVHPVTQAAGPPASHTPDPTADEAALVAQLAAQQQTEHIPYGHLHTIQPISAQKHAAGPPIPAQPKVTQPPDAAILNLARNDDLNVATIAREAHKQRPQTDNGEVVISLH